MIMLNFIKDYIWWYKKYSPVYGRISYIFPCLFNAMHFKRDGSYKINTDGTPNE